MLEENNSFESVIGSVNMPYLNGLANKYAVASGYFANAHPSLPNYFMLTTGQEISDNDSLTSTVSADNFVRHLIAAGKTWKEYSQDLPSVGYFGDEFGLCAQHHNPLSYFSDVRVSSPRALNLVPFTEFSTDINSHALADYSFIIPDNSCDAHGCLLDNPGCDDAQKLQVADQWLQSNIDPPMSLRKRI